MPFKKTWEDRGVYFRQEGAVTGEDLLECAESLCSDERLPNLKYKIIEFVEGREFDVTANSIREVAAVDKRGAEINPAMKVAIVAPSALIVGMARMYELSGGDGAWETRVFESMQEAREWVVSREPSLPHE